MLKENIHNSYPLLLGQRTEVMKSKLNQRTVSSQPFTTFYALELVNLINSIIFKFEVQKYLPILLHQENTNFYTLYQVNITNEDYLDKLNNLVEMESTFKGNIHDQDIIDIVTEVKYLGGGYEILETDNKEAVKQASK